MLWHTACGPNLPLGTWTFQGIVLDGLTCKAAILSFAICIVTGCLPAPHPLPQVPPEAHSFGQDRDTSCWCCCQPLMSLLNQPFGLLKGNQTFYVCEQHQHRIFQNGEPFGPVVCFCAIHTQTRQTVKCSPRTCVKWSRLVSGTAGLSSCPAGLLCADRQFHLAPPVKRTHILVCCS